MANYRPIDKATDEPKRSTDEFLRDGQWQTVGKFVGEKPFNAMYEYRRLVDCESAVTAQEGPVKISQWAFEQSVRLSLRLPLSPRDIHEIIADARAIDEAVSGDI